MALRPAGLASLPRVRLAVLPTPLTFLPRLSEAVGLEVWVKRDDLTGLGLGGNKARKLEFLAGRAQADGCNVLVTGGGPGSNHVQLTAAAAARLGLRCSVVVYGDAPPHEPLNLRLTRRLGAEVSFTGDPDRGSVDAGIEARCRELGTEGGRPLAIPRGGASPLGCAGYVEAVFELVEQLEEVRVAPRALVLATGSCGTQAGLALGTALAGMPHRVIGVSVSRPVEECVGRVVALSQACSRLLGEEPPAVEPVVLNGFLGPGYGKASPEGDRAAALAARTEGLILDPAFTAKAMAALVVEAGSGRLTGPLVFLHTGGAGGLAGGEL